MKTFRNKYILWTEDPVWHWKVCLCLESCLEIKWVHLEALLCPFPCLCFLVPTGVAGHFLCIQVTARILSPRLILAVSVSQTGGSVTSP